MPPRVRRPLAWMLLIAAPALALAAALEPLQTMLSSAGILDSTILSGKVNSNLTRLYREASSAKTPGTAQKLTGEIQKAAQPYQAYQRCAQAAESNDDDAKGQYCSQATLKSMESSIDEAKLQNLRYLVGDSGAPHDGCDEDQRFVCRLECYGKDTCKCCVK